ncbi:hypothetical protein, partial [Piscirickettsia salmonis]|uniref:hypothetical protein n=1 Tax=Piscirickettsia salmonis TaxID=1238 RepID=UPI001E5DE0E8
FLFFRSNLSNFASLKNDPLTRLKLSNSSILNFQQKNTVSLFKIINKTIVILCRLTNDIFLIKSLADVNLLKTVIALNE